MRRSLATFALAVLPAISPAQQDSVRVPGDTVLYRARDLLNAGRDTEGRKIIDSVLRTRQPSDPLYAEALYWRAALAATAAEAEKDYERVLIEAPLSRRAEDATLQLANLLQARGDRRGASDYLGRFMLKYANSPARPRVAVTLARLLFDQGPQQHARACEALRDGREAIPAQNFELRNQLEFYAPRCEAYFAAAQRPDSALSSSIERPRDDTVHRSAASTRVSASRTQASTGDSARADSARRDTGRREIPSRRASGRDAAAAQAAARRGTGPAATFYSVQLAAYDSRASADQLVATLATRGVTARVDGAARPFRVRVGRYATRAEATKAAASLKAKGHNGFVTTVSGR